MDDDRTHEALRELAAMYLTGRDADANDLHEAFAERPSVELDPWPNPVVPEPPSAGPSELALVGHLPGMANLWLNQYAQRIGEQYQLPTVVWRIEAQAVEVDVLHAGDNGHTFPSIEAGCLEELIAAIGQRPVYTLLHTIDAADPMAHALADMGRWTLLSGADEAAVVAAYRLLKQNLEQRDDADRPLPHVRVMFLGVNHESAEQAALQVQRTARRFLGVEPQMAGVQQRMGAVRRVHLGRFVLDPAGIDALMKLIRRLQDAQVEQEDHVAWPGDEPVEMPVDPQPMHLHLAQAYDEPIEPQAPAAEVQVEPAVEPIVTMAEFAISDFPAAPLSTRESIEGEQPARPISLHEFIPGLALLEARCPHHESVELALDSVGVLHLLLFADQTHDAAARQLAEVAAWAKVHAKLLAMTHGADGWDTSAAVIPHLFTDQPKACLSLASADLLRVHALQAVHVAGSSSWAHVELN